MGTTQSNPELTMKYEWMLRKNTRLDLVGNSLSYDDAIALGEALRTNCTVIELNLRGNDMTAEGVVTIVEALKQNSTLKLLYLGDNELAAEGANAISEALKFNSTLTELGLGHNWILSEGTIAIAEMLKINKTLISLDLFGNEVTTEGFQAIADALRVNSTLQTLNLEGNRICELGAAAIAAALVGNTALTRLDGDWLGPLAVPILHLPSSLSLSSNNEILEHLHPHREPESTPSNSERAPSGVLSEGLNSIKDRGEIDQTLPRPNIVTPVEESSHALPHDTHHQRTTLPVVPHIAPPRPSHHPPQSPSQPEVIQDVHAVPWPSREAEVINLQITLYGISMRYEQAKAIKDFELLKKLRAEKNAVVSQLVSMDASECQSLDTLKTQAESLCTRLENRCVELLDDEADGAIEAAEDCDKQLQLLRSRMMAEMGITTRVSQEAGPTEPSTLAAERVEDGSSSVNILPPCPPKNS